MTEEELEMAIEIFGESMDESMQHLAGELTKIRAGKASPTMLSGIMVEYYGSPTPLNQVSNVGTTDSRTISIQPWEKGMLGTIEKAIFEANLGLTPMNDGEFIRINIPPLTEERRIQLVKQAKSLGEDTKVSLRSARHKVMDAIKSAVKNGYPEDAGKRREAEIEKQLKAYYEKTEGLVKTKEEDIMTI
ncbi:MAG: ribosome recycling factor [Saprospiraceae bacterium]|nr:ribosome recycling factor [Saprospiraceae bacterium]